MIEPFYFGPQGRQMFAVYHPPAGGDGQTMTVICPPLLSDCARSQPALRELALSLADRGQHVIRFDYRGTGDSDGDLADVRVASLTEDIVSCVAEGRELFGDTRVRLVGVRLSALLVGKAVPEIDGFDRGVLWDPVIDGGSYLRSLRDAQIARLESDYLLSKAERRVASGQFGSYAVSRDLQADLELLDSGVFQRISSDRLVCVVTSERYRLEGIRTESVKFDCQWDSTDEDRVMPQPVLERIVKCLA